MTDHSDEHAGPMFDPPHLGEMIREGMDDVGWNVTETAERLGCKRGTLSRFLNGKTGLSPDMALALEAIGWSNADYWMRMQAAYDLAQARLRRDQREEPRRLAAEKTRSRGRAESSRLPLT